MEWGAEAKVQKKYNYLCKYRIISLALEINNIFQSASKKDSSNIKLIVIFHREFCYLTSHVAFSIHHIGFDVLVM